jgi:hypothetical protein
MIFSRRKNHMSIPPLLANTAFDPDTVALLSSAFDKAWDKLKTSGSSLTADDQALSTRELLAKRIVERALKGERDERRLMDDALAHLALPR